MPRQSARGNDPRFLAQFGDHAFDDAIHQADVAKVEAALQMCNGVGTNHFGRALDVYAAQPRCAREERIGAEAEAGSDGAAQVLAFG